MYRLLFGSTGRLKGTSDKRDKMPALDASQLTGVHCTSRKRSVSRPIREQAGLTMEDTAYVGCHGRKCI